MEPISWTQFWIIFIACALTMLACRVLPLCQGGCLRRDEEPFSECNPMKFIIEDMVLGYYKALQV